MKNVQNEKPYDIAQTALKCCCAKYKQGCAASVCSQHIQIQFSRKVKS